jgi:hypothetical protein
MQHIRNVTKALDSSLVQICHNWYWFSSIIITLFNMRAVQKVSAIVFFFIIQFSEQLQFCHFST